MEFCIFFHTLRTHWLWMFLPHTMWIALEMQTPLWLTHLNSHPINFVKSSLDTVMKVSLDTCFTYPPARFHLEIKKTFLGWYLSSVRGNLSLLETDLTEGRKERSKRLSSFLPDEVVTDSGAPSSQLYLVITLLCSFLSILNRNKYIFLWRIILFYKDGFIRHRRKCVPNRWDDRDDSVQFLFCQEQIL